MKLLRISGVHGFDSHTYATNNVAVFFTRDTNADERKLRQAGQKSQLKVWIFSTHLFRTHKFSDIHFWRRIGLFWIHRLCSYQLFIIVAWILMYMEWQPLTFSVCQSKEKHTYEIHFCNMTKLLSSFTLLILFSVSSSLCFFLLFPCTQHSLRKRIHFTHTHHTANFFAFRAVAFFTKTNQLFVFIKKITLY